MRGKSNITLPRKLSSDSISQSPESMLSELVPYIVREPVIFEGINILSGHYRNQLLAQGSIRKYLHRISKSSIMSTGEKEI